MRFPDLPHLASLVSEVVEGLESGDERCWRWSIHGQPAWGKSSFLQRVAAALRDDGKRVLYLAPPLGARDSGIVAASQLSLELSANAVQTAEHSHYLHDPGVTWATKLALLRDALDAVRGDVVILVDDPDAWASSRREGHDYATAVALLVQSLGVKVVVTSSRARGPARDWISRECGRTDAYEGWLDAHELGRLSTLRDPQRGQLIPDIPPPAVRALAGFAELTSAADAREIVTRACSQGHAIPREIYVQLGAEHEDVRRAWRYLAVLRRPFDESLLTRLDAPPSDTPGGRLLREGLLMRYRDAYVLHDALRRAVPRESTQDHGELRDAHLTCSSYYLARSDAQQRPTHLIEAFHHASAALDVNAVSRVQLQFAEQAWIFADRLFEARRAGDAGRCLELVENIRIPTRAGGDDGGAGGPGGTVEFHARRAFAADAACDAETAERHYREALQVDVRVPKLHSRFICFLLDLGRVREARLAWERALGELPQAEDLDGDDLAVLHAQVAWRLVRVHDLDFAETVLKEVPQFDLENIPTLRTVHARLRALRLAQRHGPVRPFGLLTDDWWRKRPDELSGTHVGEQLQRWWAGRVADVDEEGVVIDIAEVEADSGRDAVPRPGSAEYTVDELRDAGVANAEALRPGSFLVAGFYGDDQTPVIRLVAVPDTHSGLPRPELDPQRYLKAQNLAA